MPVTITDLDVQAYLDNLKDEFPRFEFFTEKPWWIKILCKIPWFSHLRTYTQTIDANIYASSLWHSMSPRRQLSTLRHERKHLRQFENYGFFIMAFLYIFVFFPIGLSWFRAKFEREGYAENCKSRVEYFGSSPDDRDACWEMYRKAFISWSYFKMWPFERDVLRWFNEDWTAALARRK